MFVIQKEIWPDGNVNYDISVQDARYDHGFNTLWGRLKRAAKALFGKPVYYNDLYLDGEESFKVLLADMEELARFTGETAEGAWNRTKKRLDHPFLENTACFFIPAKRFEKIAQICAVMWCHRSTLFDS